jgi:hypothetical protein
MEYFNHYNNINKQLAELTEEIQKDLSGKGLNSLPIVPTISVGSRHYAKYLKSLSNDISHKMVATRAGREKIITAGTESDILFRGCF